MKKTICIGLLGFGTVGRGVYQLLEKNKEKIGQAVGREIKIKRILVSSLEKHQHSLHAGLPLTDQFDDILQDESIQIIVEVMGSMEVAKEYITRSLHADKNVVTANKDLLAVHGEELLQLGQKKGKLLLFEGSVGGGIPIIHALMNSYAGDCIEEIRGILNGTTNFMLTKMQQENISYEQALDLAQQLGFAESDPAGDVEGLDAARKLVILARLAFGTAITLAEIDRTGITAIQPEDFEIAKKSGCTIKLMARAKEENNGFFAEVAPLFVPLNNPLAMVENENNAVYVRGEAVGETFFSGPGAGRMPTANSVVSDIMTVAKQIRQGTEADSFSYPDLSEKPEKSILEREAVIRLSRRDMPSQRQAAMLLLKETGLQAAAIPLENEKYCYYKIAALDHLQLEALRVKLAKDKRFHLDAVFFMA